MPVFYDPYTALQFRKQREATGGPALTPDQLEAMGYGVTSAQADKQLASRGLALQEKTEAARESEFQQQLSQSGQLSEEQLALQKRGQNIGLVGTGVSTAATLPLTYMAYKNLMGTPSTAQAAGTTGSQALTYGGEGTALSGGAGTATYESASAGGGLGMGGVTSEGTMTSGEMGTGAGLGAYGATVGVSAIAGYYGAEYGPGSTKDVGTVGTLGMGGQKEKKVTGGAMKGAGAGAATGAAIGSIYPGVGTAVGAVVGAIVGGIGGAVSQSVICTELCRQGYISQEYLTLEKVYKPNFDWHTYWGYRLWADTVVKGMKKSPLLTWFVSLFGIPFLKEIAHRVEPYRKGNSWGALIIKVGVPFCRWNFRRNVRKYQKFYARFTRIVEE